jgi:hypothetical protein
MDATGILINNYPGKKSFLNGEECAGVLGKTTVDRGVNVTVGGCCNVTGVYFPPMVIFKGIKILESSKHNSLAESTL